MASARQTARYRQDVRFMSAALSMARGALKKGQTPFGACIVRQGRIIALAHNEVWKRTDITAHAEITAIRKACRKLKCIDLSECVIYSTTEPCPMCFAAIHWAGISRIVYGAAIGDASRAGFRELAISCRTMKKLGRSPIRITSRVLAKGNKSLMARFAKRQNKNVY